MNVLNYYNNAIIVTFITKQYDWCRVVLTTEIVLFLVFLRISFWNTLFRIGCNYDKVEGSLRRPFKTV